MSVPVYQWRALNAEGRSRALARPASSKSDELVDAVRDIIAAVRNDGDDALAELSARFDGVAPETLRVDDNEIAAAALELTHAQRAAITNAIENVRAFHACQRAPDLRVETRPGVVCERVSHALDAVGLYVPAGSAPLPSAAIMLAVPAAIAGCPLRVLCSPPGPDGRIDPGILFAASEAGVTDIFKVGGAQAIAAMAYGTPSIPKVQKVFGPGNAWVTEAKAQVSADPGGAAQDLPAGPSEVMVIADRYADPQYVAADLLSQAEHGADSQAILLTDSTALLDHVTLELARLAQSLERRETIGQALAHSALIEVADLDEAVAISNAYAPEHLIINTRDARQHLAGIRNAGSVFLGALTPEALGDYCSGTNHVLPTYGYAQSYSGLGVEQFLRYMTIQEVDRNGLQQIGPVAVTLSTMEGLTAHRLAVELRLAEAKAS